jgi:hypothetical protein
MARLAKDADKWSLPGPPWYLLGAGLALWGLVSLASERPYGGWLLTAGLLCIVIHHLQRIAGAKRD